MNIVMMIWHYSPLFFLIAAYPTTCLTLLHYDVIPLEHNLGKSPTVLHLCFTHSARSPLASLCGVFPRIMLKRYDVIVKKGAACGRVSCNKKKEVGCSPSHHP